VHSNRKPVSEITDRAKRYRAHRVYRLKKNCELCGSRKNLLPDHKDGNESNGRSSNMRTLCKSCNGKEAFRLKRLGRGVRTRQFNPDKKGARSLGAYVSAAVSHTRGAHDAGGKLIHETPKWRRREFAREIAERKATSFRVNPKRVKRRNAGEQSAEQLYTDFHGRAPSKTKTFPSDVDYNNHPKLAQLGVANSLWVGERCELILHERRGVTEIRHTDPDDEGWCVRIDFKWNPPDVASEPSGRQMYFVGGNQDISAYLRQFHVDERKDWIDLGPCVLIEYETQKEFDKFEPYVYFHALGEETGEYPGDNGLNPRLMYNRVRKRLFLSGGSYVVKPEGIVD
jgi:hypothetical protein